MEFSIISVVYVRLTLPVKQDTENLKLLFQYFFT